VLVIIIIIANSITITLSASLSLECAVAVLNRLPVTAEEWAVGKSELRETKADREISCMRCKSGLDL